MFEYGFIKLIKLTHHNQISQFPQIIQQVVTKVKSPFVSIKCWSTLPQWDNNNWMTVIPSRHLVLINGYTHQGPWYEGDSHLSYRDPHALARCWSNYFNNYHFVGSTGRISIFTTRPYSSAIRDCQWTNHDDPRKFITRKP